MCLRLPNRRTNGMAYKYSMRILIVFLTIAASRGSSAATDVDRFVAAYQQKNSAALMPFLKVYQGTAVYPYILVRQLSESVVKQAVINPSVATLFNQYPHSMASQKLRISYLKYWAQQRNWNNYALYYRGLDVRTPDRCAANHSAN